jgi:hypothetical protein
MLSWLLTINIFEGKTNISSASIKKQIKWLTTCREITNAWTESSTTETLSKEDLTHWEKHSQTLTLVIDHTHNLSNKQLRLISYISHILFCSHSYLSSFWRREGFYIVALELYKVNKLRRSTSHVVRVVCLMRLRERGERREREKHMFFLEFIFQRENEKKREIRDKRVE